jgi:hypothetical protein
MFRIQNLETGVIRVDGDESLLSKIEGKDLSGIDISDLKLDAQTLSKQYLLGESNLGPVTVVNGISTYGYQEAKRYAVLKNAYLAKFSK